MNEIAAVVILYNPNPNVVKNIVSYIDFMEKIYVIDNSEVTNVDVILQLKLLSKIKYIKNGGNLGISMPLNMILKILHKKYIYLMTMDQDSSFDVKYLMKYIKQVSLLKNENIIGLSPCVKITNSLENEAIIWHFADYCMTSGNIINIEKAINIGGFNDKLFIDEVDNEFYYRAKKYDYKLIQFKSGIYMNHMLGERRKLAGVYYRQHDYRRVYYIIRNKLIIADLYPALKIRYYSSILKKALKILFFEDDKLKKFKSIKVAFLDYLNKKDGKKLFDF